MSRVIFIIALVALTFSLAKSAVLTEKQDISEGLTKMMDSDSKKDEVDPVEMFRQVMSQCNETFTIEKAYIQALNDSGSFPDETERSPKCYVRCLLENLGVANEDGVYDPTQMEMVMNIVRMGSQNKDGFKDITVQCNDRKESCKCDRAYQYAKCVLQEDIKRST